MDVPQPALLDQLSLVIPLVTVPKILAPTMQVALALSINILTQDGHNADLKMTVYFADRVEGPTKGNGWTGSFALLSANGDG